MKKNCGSAISVSRHKLSERALRMGCMVGTIPGRVGCFCKVKIGSERKLKEK